MPVKDRNPFGPNTVEEGKADVGVEDPFTKPTNVIKCPVCGEGRHEMIECGRNTMGIVRTCRTCKNVWSGGTVGGAVSAPVTDDQMMPPPAPDPEEDVPPDIRLGGSDGWWD
jgi:ribosomal protein L37AE/L43A